MSSLLHFMFAILLSLSIFSDNYIIMGENKTKLVVIPERYVQTQLQSLSLGNSPVITQCPEEGGKNVVS